MGRDAECKQYILLFINNTFPVTGHYCNESALVTLIKSNQSVQIILIKITLRFLVILFILVVPN